MKKEQVLARLKEDCLVAVVRAKNLEQGEKVIDAIIEGGINFIEICTVSYTHLDVYKRQAQEIDKLVKNTK